MCPNSPDLALLVDLTATNCGVGLALRLLTALEPDVAASFRPAGLQLASQHNRNSLEFSILPSKIGLG